MYIKDTVPSELCALFRLLVDQKTVKAILKSTVHKHVW